MPRLTPRRAFEWVLSLAAGLCVLAAALVIVQGVVLGSLDEWRAPPPACP